jgi:hypothetical protein
MRSLFCGTFIVCLSLAATAPVRGDDAAASALLDKAIKAAYGNTDRTKNTAISWKGKGVFQGFGMPVEFTGEWFVQRPDKMKNQIDIDAGGMKISIIQVINGDKAWRSAMGEVKELTEDELAQSKEELYANAGVALAGLKDPKFKITMLPDLKVDGHTLQGIKVASAGHNDISLYFDDKGLVAKSVRKVKDMMSGQDVDQETVYSDYKDFDGVQRFKKITVKRDGKDFVDMEIAEYKTQDKFPDSVFSKPGE